MYLWLLGRPQIQNILPPTPLRQKILIVCINMAPSMPTDNKKHRKKKLATILCPVIIPPPPTHTHPTLSFERLLIHTWSYFRNSGHNTNSLIITNIVGAHWNCYWEINVTGSLNHWPCIFWPLLCRMRIYGVYAQPLLQWSTTKSQGLIQKFPCTICTSRSIQRKNIHFDFGKINML